MSDKTPEIENHLNVVSSKIFNRPRTLCIENQTCVTCGNDAKEFRDELSSIEYGISGLCQKCQDSIWPDAG